MPVRAVTFDAHGTLILPEPSVGAIYAERARRFGLEREPDELDAAFVPAFKAATAASRVPFGSDPADAERFWHEVIGRTFGGELPAGLAADLFDHFGTGACWRALPGAHAAIALVRARGLPVVVCSNFDARVRRVLSDLDLVADEVFTSAELGAAKPDPLILRHAAAWCGVEPTELLHVGDHPREDAEAAAAVGCAWLPVERERGIDLAALTAQLA